MNKKIIMLPILLLSAISTSALAATTFYVANPGVGLGTKDCRSALNACGNLQAAQNAASSGDNIDIAKGEYVVSAGCQITLDKALTITGGYNDTFTSRSDDAATTVFTANGGDICRLLVIDSGQEAWLTLDTLTFTGATHSTNDSGLFLSLGSWLRLDNVTVTGNILSRYDGFGAIQMSAGDKLDVLNSEISHNQARGIATDEKPARGSAGAIYLPAGSSATIDNTSFISNTAVGSGGAIYSDQATLAISDSTFTSNQSGKSGGAVYITSATAEDVSIEGSSFTSNSSLSAGGAMWAGSTGSLKIERNTFDANTTDANGGALAVANGNITIINNTFYGNVADVSADSSGKRGGAINFGGFGAGSEAVVAYNTMMDNEARSADSTSLGGGIHINDSALGVVTLTANLIFNNSAEFGPNVDDIDKLVDGGFNLIGHAGNAGMYSAASGAIANASSWGGTSFTAVESELTSIIEGTLQKNGGGVKTLKLKEDSIARNAVVYDGIEGFGQGQSIGWPFTTIKQATGAIKVYPGYGTAKEYFFDMDGLGVDVFKSKAVDEDGRILVDKATAAVLTETGLLIENSDSTETKWVSSTGACNGTITGTDGRGLPRSDFINPNDQAQFDREYPDCDIGAFEWNNGYQLDCYDEDGDRPVFDPILDLEEGTLDVNQTMCFGGDIFGATPGALLDNLGTMNKYYLMLLGLLGFVRMRKA